MRGIDLLIGAERHRSFSAAEASAITGIELKRIRHAMERGPLRNRNGSKARKARRLNLKDILFLFVWDILGKEGVTLTHERQTGLYLQVKRFVGGAAQVGGSVSLPLTLTLSKAVLDSEYFLGLLTERVGNLDRARERIISDPETMGGHPVFKGTRIPVHAIAEMLEQGAPRKEMEEGYPSLSAADFDLALLYASAYPQRGRPQAWRDQKPAS